MKAKHMISALCAAILLTGCAILPQREEVNTWDDSGFVTVGDTLTVTKTDDRLNFLNNIDTLTAEGLYYAAWSIGELKTYETSDENEINYYDAQVYLLLGESKSEDDAAKRKDEWLDVARVNYEIIDEEEITCNDQTYLFITYNCINEDNPYSRGASAFAVREKHAVCIEFTCTEDFEGDAKTLLTEFLDNCSYL